MNVLSIDPGKTGAYALLTPERARVYDFHDGTGAAKDWWITYHHLTQSLRRWGSRIDEWTVALEKVHSRIGNSMPSVFTFGMNVGGWKALLEIAGFENVVEVDPRQWKAFYGLKAGDKKAALQLARELFPELEGCLERAKDHNRAEALLLGEYWRRVNWHNS